MSLREILTLVIAALVSLPLGSALWHLVNPSGL